MLPPLVLRVIVLLDILICFRKKYSKKTHQPMISLSPARVAGVASGGVAQTVLPLTAGQRYYSTVRAFNNDGRALQSVSDGFTVDTSAPLISFVR